MEDRAQSLIEQLSTELAGRAGSVSPSSAWGVFDAEGLVHVEGTGDAGVRPRDTAFRIASCTKSFTAAAALLLVEEGMLDLDEPLAEASDVPLRVLGGGAPTLRDALTMRSGFPTDDPWADRQESISDDRFAAMLGSGVRSVRAAGSAYEYSNLGYAIVGRIVARRAGEEFHTVVADRLLRPLGLDATGFTPDVAARGGVVPGYRRGPGGWVLCPFSGPGAFSPIGGLFSTVGDLARWIVALGRSADGRGPLPAEVALALARPQTAIAGDRDGAWSAYGMGLVVRGDGARRTLLGHAGGYPGFGAYLEWDTATGVGAVVLENATYAGPSGAVRRAMDRVVGRPTEPPAPAVAGEPWAETTAAVEMLRRSLPTGGFGDGDRYDACVELDRPFAERADELESMLGRIGPVRAIGDVEHAGPARAGFTIVGTDGALAVELTMTPLAETRIQSLRVAEAPPE